MTYDVARPPRSSVRRTLSWALVVALCAAALTAITGILNGGFDDTDARVIGTSLGFAIFSATAAAGASVRLRQSEWLRAVGLTTMAVSGAGFGLLLLGIWNDAGDDTWRWFGSVSIATLACSHASLVGGARRRTDAPVVDLLSGVSIVLGAVEATFGVLAVAGTEEVSEGFGQLMAVLVVLLLLATALPPILRRLEPAVARAEPPGEQQHSLATEVLAAADRIEALNGDPGNRAPEIRRECQRLRELARSHSH